jgi:alkaline phosphatase D
LSGPVFQHGVASGDPLPDAIVLWTRVTTGEESTPVDWVLARDPELTDVVASGQATAQASDDHSVHVDVRDIDAADELFFRFSALGEDSPVARTRLLPGPGTERLRFATCSCAKFNAGFFNAYGRIAERRDLNFLLHLGDYIYEASNTPPKNQTPGADIGRPFDPVGECRTLDDYRTRYSQYHRDPDVQALHHSLPVIPTLDDHELADGAWSGGSDAHVESEHGPWSERKAAAFKARWEWLPVRPPDPADPTRAFRTVSVGDLARIHLLDIRSRRDQPALEPEMSDPSRSMMGAAQRDWLFGELESHGPGWTFLGCPSILTRTWVDDAGEPLATALLKLKLMDEDGEGPDEDQWDGYPAERQELLRRLGDVDDAVVLSADIHVSVTGEVRLDDQPVAIEITAPSLTSQNLDEKLGVDPRDPGIQEAEGAFVNALSHVHWCEFSGHGYTVIDVDPGRVRAEWWHVDTVLERTTGEKLVKAVEVPRGEVRLAEATN